MIVVDPINIDDSNFQSSTIQEPDLTIGEKEWVSTPFDGYDISGIVQAPVGVVKVRGRDVYGVLDPTAELIYWFNSSFSFIGTSTGFNWGDGETPVAIGSWGLVGTNEKSGVAVLEKNGIDPEWALRAIDEDGPFEGVFWREQPISIFTPIAHATYGSSEGKNIFVVLDDSGSGNYRVKGYDLEDADPFSDPVLIFDNPLTLNGRTPVGIDCRRGNYTVLFNSGSDTSIAYYNSEFSTEISSHLITGFNPDGPYDAFTIDDVDGFKLMKTTTRKIYNIDSFYNHGSSYKPGDQAIKSAIHKKYQCLIETVQDPEIGVDEVPPTWLELGATNRWAMFDGINTYQSKSNSTVVVGIRPIGLTNSVSVLNMSNCKEVKIVTSFPDTGDSYTVTHDTSGKYDLVEFDLPPYENPTIEVTFTPEDGLQMSIGELVVGESTRIGVLLAGTISDRIDYSRYDYDEFGNLTYIKRPIVKYNTYPIRVMKADAPGVELYLDNISGKQAVWVGNIGGGDYLIVRGNLERSPMTYDNPSIIEYTLKVRGSI